MEALSKVFGVAFLGIGVLFLLIILSTLMGGICGWTVGLIFTDTIAALKQFMGVDVTNFELGAMLGFVGGFLKSTPVNSK